MPWGLTRVLACVLCAVPLYAQLPERGTYEFTTVDVPNAYATVVRAINASGMACGTYTTSVTGPWHSFLRGSDGRITTFDVPGSAITVATGINSSGVVVGFWAPDTTAAVEHGFFRGVDGQITSFDTPGYQYAAAAALNDRGDTVVNALQEPGPAVPLRRDSNGNVTSIPLPGLNAPTVNGLNDAGTIVGASGKAAFIASIDGSGPVITFSAPRATTSTVASGVNDLGVVVGSWNSGQGYQQITHGFLRQRNGIYRSIEFPGALSTAVYGINVPGDLAGTYTAGDQSQHGFIATPAPSRSVQIRPEFITIDVPGSGDTEPLAINSEGEVAGLYRSGVVGVSHGFIREPDGEIVTFDAPGAAMTSATGINDKGEVIGFWNPDLTGNVAHSFLRDASGNFTSFDVLNYAISTPSAITNGDQIAINALTEPGPSVPYVGSTSGMYTQVMLPGFSMPYVFGLNNAGAIVGCYFLNGGFEQSFLLTPGSQTPVTFTFPNSTVRTCANAINDEGEIVGDYTLGFRGGQTQHAFLRYPDGTMVNEDYPLSRESSATGINDRGWIVGTYVDQLGQNHGFLRIPPKPPIKHPF
jgi:hypothetical protein